MERLKGVALLIGTALILWALSEASLRAAGYHGIDLGFEPLVFSPPYGWENKPDYDADWEDIEWRVRYRTNADGFRGPAYSRERTPGTKRILVISDSMGDGFGVEEPEMWQSVLASRHKSPVEIVNQSVRGYDAIQEYKRFLTYGRTFHPDIVIQALCDNDVGGWENSVIARYRRFRPQFTVTDGKIIFASAAEPPNELVPESGIVRSGKRLFYRSAAIAWLKYRITPLYQRLGHMRSEPSPENSVIETPPEDASADHYDAQYPEAFRIIYRDFAAIAKEDHFRMMIVWISTKPVPPLLQTAIEGTGISIVPVAVPPEEMFFFDPFHPRAPGHQRIADAVEAALPAEGGAR